MPRPWLTSASMMLVLPFCSTTFAVGSLSRIACTDRPEKVLKSMEIPYQCGSMNMV